MHRQADLDACSHHPRGHRAAVPLRLGMRKIKFISAFVHHNVVSMQPAESLLFPPVRMLISRRRHAVSMCPSRIVPSREPVSYTHLTLPTKA